MPSIAGVHHVDLLVPSAEEAHGCEPGCCADFRDHDRITLEIVHVPGQAA